MNAPAQADQSEIVHHRGGTVTVTGPDAILYYKAVQLKSFIGLYMRSGIIPTRGVGIKRMLEIAAEITKPEKKYSTSKADQQRALSDITVWCDTMKAALPIRTE